MSQAYMNPNAGFPNKEIHVPRKRLNTTAVKNTFKSATKAIKINFAGIKDDVRWEELQQIEKRRRAILLKTELPIWQILLSWDGTVMRILLWDKVFWITMAIYVGIRLLAQFGDLPSYLSQLPSDSITVLGGFLSFFLVFWVNQNNSRYFSLYQHSMSCKGRIFDAATLAVTNLPYAQATRLVRYMNVAHAAGYVGLSKIYPSRNYFNYINKAMGLLTEEERARLDHIDLDKGGSCNREVIVWCMNEIQCAQKKGLIDDYLTAQFRDQIMKLRAATGQLYNAKDLPIPFFYVHFICLLTTLYLPLFAATTSIQAGTGENAHWINGVVRGLIVMLQAIFVLGLRILGQKMSDPYGDDLVDLSVMFYVHFTWQMSNRILNAHFPEEASAVVEDSLKREREHLGDAWENALAASVNGSHITDSDASQKQSVSGISADLEGGLSNMENGFSKAVGARIIFNPAL